MKKKIIHTIITLIFISIAVVSAFQIYHQLKEYFESADSYTDLREYVSIHSDTKNPSEDVSEETQSGETQDISWPEMDFEILKSINQETVGWILIEGTKINYPIVQGKDNQYYLKHLFDGKYNNSGCIFLDSRNSYDFSDRHSIVYGHHMKNGTMFSELTKYKQQAYYEEHPVILLTTPNKNYEVRVFAGYVANVKDNAWKLDFISDSDFETWLKTTKKISCFTSDIIPSVTDKIITMSTCSYEFENARFVVLGVLV